MADDDGKFADRGSWDNRGKYFDGGQLGGVDSGSAFQNVLEGVRQMNGFMIVAFVTPVAGNRAAGVSASSIRFEALRADLRQSATKSQ